MKKIFFIAFSFLFLSAAYTNASSLSSAAAYLLQDTASINSVKVQFISKGSGIDNEGYDKVIAFLNSHPKKLKYDVKSQGREGEKEITIWTPDFKKAKMKKLAKKIKSKVKKKDLVIVHIKQARLRSKF
jgi:hypothetical protein